ncbi:MAG: CheR family methyltransferase, partial [Dehalococcoidia bacterium]
PNKNMTIIDRTLRLGEQPERPGISHSIDLFFRSLATDLQEKAICIILSGTGNDGSRGARAVKAEMGMVMVQEPKTAGYDGMPMAAVDAGVADFVLPPEEMPEQLIQYIRKSYGKRRIRREQIKIQTGTLSNILSLVRSKTKHDFTGYKQSTINRRIERRMSINQIDDINQYLRYLSEHTGEVEALVKDFLINVTSFFRDKEAFSILKEYMKTYISRKTDGEEIRAWVTGCSTGEEAYSMAIVLEEAQEELGRFFRLQIFGTDLDQDAIEAARTGIYPPSIIADVSKERLDRFFIRKDDHFQIKRELREKLIFAVQDIIVDPPFTRLDLISARNLLIYFESDLQQKLISIFNYALNQGGILFLGTAETVGEFTDGFEILDRRWKLYRERTKMKGPGFTFLNHPSWKEPPEATPRYTYRTQHPYDTGDQFPEKLLLEAMPPSVLINNDYQIIYTHGRTGKYIELPEGRPNMNILDLVHSELRTVLTTGLKEAQSTGERIIRQSIKVKINGSSLNVRVTVTPVLGGAPGQIIVTFEDIPEARRRGRTGKDQQMLQLEQELQFTKETLRSTIEDLETANEELRSANEEYQSTNEELQSTNEELETSREELQSLNEELTTVNTEHQRKIEELSTINDDMNNLLNSTGVATIFLDEELNLKRFTPAATAIFNLIKSDVDRPISHITSQLEDYDVAQHAQKVLDDLIPLSENARGNNGKWYEVRINAYRTTENAISGVVVTFIDITGIKMTEQEIIEAKTQVEDKLKELGESEKRFRTLVTASSEV